MSKLNDDVLSTLLSGFLKSPDKGTFLKDLLEDAFVGLKVDPEAAKREEAQREAAMADLARNIQQGLDTEAEKAQADTGVPPGYILIDFTVDYVNKDIKTFQRAMKIVPPLYSILQLDEAYIVLGVEVYDDDSVDVSLMELK